MSDELTLFGPFAVTVTGWGHKEYGDQCRLTLLDSGWVVIGWAMKPGVIAMYSPGTGVLVRVL